MILVVDNYDSFTFNLVQLLAVAGADPKVVRNDEGDVWLFDNGERVRPLGLMAAAGASYLDFRPAGLTYETIRRGFYEVTAHLADMDADGIGIQLLYPSVCEEGARMFGDERGLQLACVRAYNEWLREFCAAGRGRLFGHAVIPATGTEDAVAELESPLQAIDQHTVRLPEAERLPAVVELERRRFQRNLVAVRQICTRFARTWQGLWFAYGEREEGRVHYRAALQRFLDELRGPAQPLLLQNELRWFNALQTIVAKFAVGADAPSVATAGAQREVGDNA